MAFTYSGNQTREISFPLGGIGTGCIGLGGDGRLRDWEIYNRPNKGSLNGFSHFAIKVEDDGSVIDTRLLHGDMAGPYSGEPTGAKFSGFGFGPRRENLTGMPHFRGTEFVGEFPFATVRFIDDTFPGSVELSGFNPFIPLAEDDSSMPAAFFEIAVRNTTDRPLTYTVAATVSGPEGGGPTTNTVTAADGTTILTLDGHEQDHDSAGFGGLAIGTAGGPVDGVSYQQYWYRGRWFDGLGVYWRDLASPGPLKNRTYDGANLTDSVDTATLARTVRVLPGDSTTVRFVLSWYFPNCRNYWSEPATDCDCGSDGSCCSSSPTWKNFYATRFRDARDVAAHAMYRWDKLHQRTRAFTDALFGSTLPPEVLDAVSANISILKSPTCLRLTDGSFYGFEGCHCTEGCCEGSCTHVWNYAYALPYLFPRLERSMRDLDYRYNMREDGQMSFRLQLPIGAPRWGFRACVDGQMGGVIKVYREWKINGDTEWLVRLWPSVKRSVDFAWAPTNEDRWDPDKSGVISGRQHHTLDMELFGPNSWLNGFYLAALKAAAEMAEVVGDATSAEEYRRIFARGKARTDSELWNGEYYQQLIDLSDRSILESFLHEGDQVLKGGSVVDAYWDDEHDEIKYQIGDGSVIDQVIAQWHANLVGLGEIFDPEQTRSALRAIYRYNYKPSLRAVANPCRIFGLNDESGTIICEWPADRHKPFVPLTYSEETMHGYEYQVACHMIQEGMVAEGLELVRAVRDRYDGEKRNPWNEIECGSNYARSMASYALLIAYSGFSVDAPARSIGFDPIFADSTAFSSFWSVDAAWGTVRIDTASVVVSVTEGRLELSTLVLPFLTAQPDAVSVRGDRPRDSTVSWDGTRLSFPDPVTIAAGESLRVTR